MVNATGVCCEGYENERCEIMETIKTGLEVFGAGTLAILAFYWIAVLWTWLERINLTWKMLIDSANESRDNARKLQQQLEELTCSHQCLYENFQEHLKSTHPKKAKSK